MKYARTALLSAAATFLLALATPAIAQVSSVQLQHPSGCARCGVVYSTAPEPRIMISEASEIGPVLGTWRLARSGGAGARNRGGDDAEGCARVKHRLAAHAEVR